MQTQKSRSRQFFRRCVTWRPQNDAFQGTLGQRWLSWRANTALDYAVKLINRLEAPRGSNSLCYSSAPAPAPRRQAVYFGTEPPHDLFQGGQSEARLAPLRFVAPDGSERCQPGLRSA